MSSPLIQFYTAFSNSQNPVYLSLVLSFLVGDVLQAILGGKVDWETGRRKEELCLPANVLVGGGDRCP